ETRHETDRACACDCNGSVRCADNRRLHLSQTNDGQSKQRCRHLGMATTTQTAETLCSADAIARAAANSAAEAHKASAIAQTSKGLAMQSDSRLTESELDNLEDLIDRRGIEDVLIAISEICDAKSEHIQVNWQDATLALR